LRPAPLHLAKPLSMRLRRRALICCAKVLRANGFTEHAVDLLFKISMSGWSLRMK
jgi:hypothetical protein